jgi:hypothetical protein
MEVGELRVEGEDAQLRCGGNATEPAPDPDCFEGMPVGARQSVMVSTHPEE